MIFFQFLDFFNTFWERHFSWSFEKGFSGFFASLFISFALVHYYGLVIKVQGDGGLNGVMDTVLLWDCFFRLLFFIRCESDVYVKRHVLQLHIWKTWKNVNDKGWFPHKVLSHAIHILFSYLTYYSSFHFIYFSYLFSTSLQSSSFKFIRL